MSSSDHDSVTRRGVLGLFASLGVVAAAPVYAKAPGLLRGAGDVRRLSMACGRTGEKVDAIYWIDGEYITPVLEEISYFMRDWRENKAITYDRRNIDILAATHRLLGCDEPLHLVSGYRTPKTNSTLRSQSSGVARNSYHMKAMAADVQLKSRSVAQMATAAHRCRAGGVGKYSRSNFVHMDCGPIRNWGR